LPRGHKAKYYCVIIVNHKPTKEGYTTLATRMPQNAYDHRSAFRSTSHIKLASKQHTRACRHTMTWWMLGLSNDSQRFQSMSYIQKRKA